MSASAVLGGGAVLLGSRKHVGWARYVPVAPMALLLGYGIAIATFGTWYAGTGPNYGAVKSIMLTTAVGLAVTLPVALAPLGQSSPRLSGRRAATSPLTVVAFAAVIFLLVVDGVLPRAMIRVAPDSWRETYETFGEDRQGYWWPAEVRAVADQPIASNPVACIYLLGYTEPAAGRTDNRPIRARGSSWVWQERIRRATSCGLAACEWLNNEEAWTNEWPNLRHVGTCYGGDPAGTITSCCWKLKSLGSPPAWWAYGQPCSRPRQMSLRSFVGSLVARAYPGLDERIWNRKRDQEFPLSSDPRNEKIGIAMYMLVVPQEGPDFDSCSGPLELLL